MKNTLACSPEIEAYILITSESLNNFKLFSLEKRELSREISVIVEKTDRNKQRIEEQKGTLYIYKVKIEKEEGLEKIIKKYNPTSVSNLDN